VRSSFTPRSIPGVAASPKHEGELCSGIRVHLEGYEFDPVRTGLEIFNTLLRETDEYEVKSFLYRLAGTRDIDRLINGDVSAEELDFGLDAFLEKRQPYLIY
jgi:uncharacterized protein YbbC (DUF1343 family)